MPECLNGINHSPLSPITYHWWYCTLPPWWYCIPYYLYAGVTASQHHIPFTILVIDEERTLYFIIINECEDVKACRWDIPMNKPMSAGLRPAVAPRARIK